MINRRNTGLTTQVRALKVYGVDDEVKIQGTPKGYKAVPESKAAKYGFATKP
jgi:hypothetical protein